MPMMTNTELGPIHLPQSSRHTGLRDMAAWRFSGRRPCTPRRFLLRVLCCAVIGLSGVPFATAAHGAGAPPPGLPPGPVPVAADCLVYRGPAQCYYHVRVTTFKFSQHVLHIGDTLTASMSTQWKEWTFPGSGPGLALKGCKGDPFAGSGICRWKVVAATGGWVSSLGLLISVPGSAQYTAADFYTVVDKNTHVIEGHVTDTAGDRLAGVSLRIDGSTKGPIVTTDSDGYYLRVVRPGAYYVSVRSGAATAKYFKPQFKQATVKDTTASVTVDFVGSIHTTIALSRQAVKNSGLETATLTIQALSPIGQPIADHTLEVYAAPPRGSQAAAVVCAASGSHMGRIAPDGMVSGSPLYLPIKQATDAKGLLTYQVYFGSAPGTLTFRVDDPSVTKQGGLGDVSAYSTVDATITSQDRASFPSTYAVQQRTSIRTKNLTLGLAGALAAVVQGVTRETFPPPAVPLGGASGDAQKALLRAIEASGLFAGFGLAPVMGTGGAHPGVLIYTGTDPNTARDTRVLDITTAQALQSYDLVKDTPAVVLPTRGAWEQQIVHGTTIIDYASAVAEQGLTYISSLPYLPAADGDLAAFDAACGTRAASL